MTTDPLSKDAVLFGLSFLNGSKAVLSFGGEGASMAITDRARAALDELLAKGFAEPDTETLEIIPGRERYRGRKTDPHLGAIAQQVGINPLDREQDFVMFEKIQSPDGPSLG